MLSPRTDLAMEASALWQKSQPKKKLAGLHSTQSTCFGYGITDVRISDREAAEAVGKPQGRYLTVDLTGLSQSEDGFCRGVNCLGQLLGELLPAGGTILTVGLGNRAMTPDAVGPLAMDAVLVTRHLTKVLPEQFGGFRPVAAAAPGVVGQTGVEAVEALGALVRSLHPAALIVVDALASRALQRVCTTVQLSDSGIVPGSGVGNHRQAIDRNSMGIPVIAVGAPTVVDGATLAADILEEAGVALEPKSLSGHGQNLFVTPRDVDAQVRRLARLIGCGINRALQSDLEMEQMLALVEER